MSRSFTRLLLLSLLLSFTAACNHSAPAPQSSTTSASNAITRYPFKGKVVSVDTASNSASIAGEDIPGFMSAMTMSYEIRPSSALQKLHAGDSITAVVVVDNSDSNNQKYWLENVTIASPKP